MPTTDLTLGFLAYSDQKPGNNPMIRNFDLKYKLEGVAGDTPLSQDLTIPPQTSATVFSGVRTLATDGTTQMSTTRPYPALNTFRFNWTGGTNPLFRTGRAIGVDDTTQWAVSLNGSVATYTNVGGTAPVLTSVVVGDILRVDPSAGFSPVNQGRFSIIGATSNSISVLNQNAAAETVTLTNTATNSFLIYSNGASSNQPQIGDNVIISAGFSPATFGTYQLVEVTPFWFDVNIVVPGGIPLQTGITPTAAGMVFYSSAKSAVLVAALDRCSVRINGDTSDNNLLEPTVVGDPQRPALYFKHGTAYQVVINNLSLNPLSVIVATVE